MGVALHGAGFIVDGASAERFRMSGEASTIRRYLGGRDLLHVPRDRYLIDFSFLDEQRARSLNPAAFQHLLDHVLPERKLNKRESIRRLWWRFGWERPELRSALKGLNRFIATTETAKHRVFQFVPGDVLPDHMVVAIASPSAAHLGVLSSRLHVIWATAAGARLGYGNDQRYTKTRCFDPFPFPVWPPEGAANAGRLAEELDTQRKRQQTGHPELTVTAMYNSLEKLRTGADLTAKERGVHEQGLISVLAEIHDRLDEAVLDAYGWSDLAPALVGKPGGTTPNRDVSPEQAEAEEELLSRLVALNAERADEERRGVIRWLRPEYQAPEAATKPAQEDLGLEGEARPAPTGPEPRPWPAGLADRARAVREALGAAGRPVTPTEIARTFRRARAPDVAELLATLAALGQAREIPRPFFGVSQVAFIAGADTAAGSGYQVEGSAAGLMYALPASLPTSPRSGGACFPLATGHLLLHRCRLARGCSQGVASGCDP